MTQLAQTDSQLLIGGTWQGSTTRATFAVNNPFNGQAATAAAAATVADANRAIDSAANAFQTWRKSSPGERRTLLLKAADLLASRSQQIAGLMSAEIGGTFGWGMFNVMLSTNMLREAAAQTYAVKGEIIPSDKPGSFAMGIRQPAGVVAAIAPWNAPVILATRAIAFPLAYGNTVVFKGSELCPAVHAEVVRVYHDAGFPEGVVNFISNAPQDAAEVVEALIAHPAVRRLNFTGSTRVGRIIAEKAGHYLKRVLLELGGKAPMIVLADADLDQAVAAAAFGAFMNQGQICMSTERIIVEAPIADEFAKRLAAKAASLRVGDPTDPSTEISCLVNKAALDRVQGMVEDARKQGAQILSGGNARGMCFEPTVIYGVTSGMRAYSEESFGPLAPIIVAQDAEHALQLANDTEYGLSSAVFTKDFSRALDLAERLETGIVHINDATVDDEAQMPFGGVKNSGWGRFGSGAAIEEFTELRWITYLREPGHYPI